MSEAAYSHFSKENFPMPEIARTVGIDELLLKEKDGNGNTKTTR